MRLTSFTDYGLRALMLMASAPERAFSTAEIADAFGVSRNHLAKIMQQLSRHGFVRTRRGSGGGNVLARAPGEIALGAVIAALEEGQALVECFGQAGHCTVQPVCKLRDRLRAAEAAFVAELDRSTLADIALAPRLSDLVPARS